jgi:hypothetical protein
VRAPATRQHALTRFAFSGGLALLPGATEHPPWIAERETVPEGGLRCQLGVYDVTLAHAIDHVAFRPGMLHDQAAHARVCVPQGALGGRFRLPGGRVGLVS